MNTSADRPFERAEDCRRNRRSPAGGAGAEIAGANETLRANGITVLRSIELNINPRGEGDMEQTSLDALDLVLGSFHSALRSKDDQTDRYLGAVRNPTLHVLGHPRGRVYNYRAGLTADWPRVFAEAQRLDKAVEVDCYPDRQDLNVDLLKLARDAGTRVALRTDSHHAWQLAFIEHGLAAALEAGIPPDGSSTSCHCANCTIGSAVCAPPPKLRQRPETLQQSSPLTR